MRIKFCVDSKNNVGIFTAEIKPDSGYVVFEESSSDRNYHISFLNEAGMVFTRIVNPDRAQRGEPLKTRQRAQVNDVYNVGSATIMILAIHEVSDSTPSEATAHNTLLNAILKSPIGPAPTPPTATVVSAAAEEEDKPIPESEIKTKVESPLLEDTFSKQLKSKSDVSKLPKVENARLNYEFEYQGSEDRFELNTSKKQDVKAKSKTKIKPTKPKEESELLKARANIQMRTRSQLFQSDLRDRKAFGSGEKYALRNKVSAAFVLLSILTILSYSFVFKLEIDKLIFRQQMQAQADLMDSTNSDIQTRVARIGSAVDMLTSSLTYSLSNSPQTPQWDSTKNQEDLRGLDPAFLRNHFLVHASIFSLEAPKRPASPVGNLDASLPSGEALKLIYQHTKSEPLKKLKINSRDLLLAHQNSWLSQAPQDRMIASSTERGFSIPANAQNIYTFQKAIVKGGKKWLVAFDIDLSFLAEAIPQTTFYRFGLLNSSGQALGLEPFVYDNEMFALTKSLGETEIQTEEIKSQKRMVAFKRAGPSLFLYSDFAVNDASVSTHTLINVLLFSFLVLVVMSLMGSWFAKTITGGLNNLTASVENIAAGNYQGFTPVEGSDEVGILSDYLAHLTSVLESKEAELVQATDLASKDPLTGLYNRGFLQKKLEESIGSVYEKRAKGFCLLLMDIDDFREFNNHYGHIQGDQVLKEFAVVLKEMAREKDFCFRFGGEEFAVLMPETETVQAAQLTERLMAKLRAHKVMNLTGASGLSLTCSMGVLAYSIDAHPSVESFLKSVEGNLIMAKRSGKNRAWTG